MDKTEIAVALFDKQAAIYQEKYMNVEAYATSLDAFCTALPKQKARLLEVACGPGNLTRYLLSQRPDLQIWATDLSPNMLKLAVANNPTAQFRLMDGRHIGQLTERFDAVVSGFFLPYLSKKEATQWIADAATVLVDGGIVYISTMEDDHRKSGWQTASNGEQVFIHYYQAADLMAILEKSNFEIIHLQRYYTPAKDGTTITDLIIIGRKMPSK
jgi:cyclopropane fatty-acyl-phospholipid synthase-like methyltransferase